VPRVGEDARGDVGPGEPVDAGLGVSERHQAELAEGFFRSLFRPIHRAISSAVESGEFSENSPELLTWAFLSLLSGMLEAEAGPSGPSQPEAFQSPEGTADTTVDLFLHGVVA
jgi:hypothetical protein